MADGRALTFEELRDALLGAVVLNGLSPYAVRTKLDLETLSRELSFLCVLPHWTTPFDQHAEVRVEYDAHQHLVALDPEGLPREPDDVTFDLAISITFRLVSRRQDVPLQDLESRVRPRILALNAALGVRSPLAVHYTVATDYVNNDRTISAQVPWTIAARVLVDELDCALLAPIRIGLEAIEGSR